jgi:hypothetical protein
VPWSYKGESLGNKVSSVPKAVKKRDSWKRVGKEPPFREDLSAEAEEFPLLEVVTRERPVKTQQAGKGLAGAVVIGGGAVIACSSKSRVLVVNKSNIQLKTPSNSHTHT